MTANRVVWWEIETSDPPAAQRFSGALFGWTFRPDFDGPGTELGRDYFGTDDFWFANIRDPQAVSLGLWTRQAPGT